MQTKDRLFASRADQILTSRNIKMQFANNQNLVLLKLLNNQHKTNEDLQAILMKVQQLAYFNLLIERFLKGTQKDTLINLCDRLHMERFKGGDVIFVEGDVSNDKLYIIFNGKVALMRARKFETFQDQSKAIPNHRQSLPIRRQKTIVKRSEEGATPGRGLQQIITTKRFVNKLITQVSVSTTQEDVMIPEADLQQLNERFGETVRFLSRGDGFGELALLQNTPRGLTACAVSIDTFLVILKKDEFDIVKNQFAQSLKEKKQLIFSKFQVQNAYSTALLQSLSYSFDIESFQMNQYLTQEGEPQKAFYLISKGDVILEKEVDGQLIKVCLLSKGQFVGEEIVFESESLCHFSARVLSITATVMIISKQEFLQKFPDECKEQLRIELNQKKRHRENFQQSTFKTVTEVGQPTKQQPPIQIELKLSRNSLRSEQRTRKSVQNIADLVKEKGSLYQLKYHDSYIRDLDGELFSTQSARFQRCLKSPRYTRISNVLVKSLHQEILKGFRRSLKKEKNFKSSSLSLKSTTHEIQIPTSVKSTLEKLRFENWSK